ncbi:hypothetical protein IW143_002909 [Coemansia sp. RSA 520]|nr:hypothetical protein IW143_002909 [Coemansia sp. RSA 520]KAJ2404783.1 hypothetical protein J3F80_004636 [Coemansia sp. RSA 2526]
MSVYNHPILPAQGMNMQPETLLTKQEKQRAHWSVDGDYMFLEILAQNSACSAKSGLSIRHHPIDTVIINEVASSLNNNVPVNNIVQELAIKYPNKKAESRSPESVNLLVGFKQILPGFSYQQLNSKHTNMCTRTIQPFYHIFEIGRPFRSKSIFLKDSKRFVKVIMEFNAHVIVHSLQSVDLSLFVRKVGKGSKLLEQWLTAMLVTHKQDMVNFLYICGIKLACSYIKSKLPSAQTFEEQRFLEAKSRPPKLVQMVLKEFMNQIIKQETDEAMVALGVPYTASADVMTSQLDTDSVDTSMGHMHPAFNPASVQSASPPRQPVNSTSMKPASEPYLNRNSVPIHASQHYKKEGSYSSSGYSQPQYPGAQNSYARNASYTNMPHAPQHSSIHDARYAYPSGPYVSAASSAQYWQSGSTVLAPVYQANGAIRHPHNENSGRPEYHQRYARMQPYPLPQQNGAPNYQHAAQREHSRALAYARKPMYPAHYSGTAGNQPQPIARTGQPQIQPEYQARAQQSSAMALVPTLIANTDDAQVQKPLAEESKLTPISQTSRVANEPTSSETDVDSDFETLQYLFSDDTEMPSKLELASAAAESAAFKKSKLSAHALSSGVTSSTENPNAQRAEEPVHKPCNAHSISSIIS